MPEYLYPGVYVTEVALNPKPIEGVSTSTISLLGSELIGELQRLVDQIPGKDPDGNNYGIALLELMAWISDTLAQRADQLGEEAYLPAARIAAAALALVRNRAQPPNSVLNVVRFYEGQLLAEDDLNVEVDYTRDKSQNKFAFGIVCGLQIGVQNGESSPSVNVTPGYALDGYGRLIVLTKPIALRLPAADQCASVIARLKGNGPVSILVLPSVKSEFLIVNEPKGDDFALGHLKKSSHGWEVTNV